MANFSDPTRKRCNEKSNTDQQNNPGGDQPPEEKGDTHGQAGWEVRWVRQWYVG
jgi:hypothetical protein